MRVNHSFLKERFGKGAPVVHRFKDESQLFSPFFLSLHPGSITQNSTVNVEAELPKRPPRLSEGKGKQRRREGVSRRQKSWENPGEERWDLTASSTYP